MCLCFAPLTLKRAYWWLRTEYYSIDDLLLYENNAQLVRLICIPHLPTTSCTRTYPREVDVHRSVEQKQRFDLATCTTLWHSFSVLCCVSRTQFQSSVARRWRQRVELCIHCFCEVLNAGKFTASQLFFDAEEQPNVRWTQVGIIVLVIAFIQRYSLSSRLTALATALACDST